MATADAVATPAGVGRRPIDRHSPEENPQGDPPDQEDGRCVDPPPILHPTTPKSGSSYSIGWSSPVKSIGPGGVCSQAGRWDNESKPRLSERVPSRVGPRYPAFGRGEMGEGRWDLPGPSSRPRAGNQIRCRVPDIRNPAPYCPTALLPYCLIALLPYCLTALLPYCPTALLPSCPIAVWPDNAPTAFIASIRKDSCPARCGRPDRP